MTGLLAPGFLAALAAVGLPVLIHWLTRPRPREVRFPAYHLLVDAGSGRQSLHRLRTWLVLATRTLFVAAVVLAFAGPYLSSERTPGTPGTPRRVALVVDASLSMRHTTGGVDLFTRARAAAADTLRSLPSGSSAVVILPGARPRPLLPDLSRNLSALHERLAAARPTHEAGDPRAALALGARLLDGEGEVRVFSDFQRTEWASAAMDGVDGVSVLLCPIGDPDPENVGVTSLTASPERPVEGETVELTCAIFNSSARERVETARLELEGVSRSSQMTLPPYGSAITTFAFSLPSAGPRVATVSVRSDGLDGDDRRYRVVDVRPRLRVLVIGDGSRRDPLSSVQLVATALAPSEFAGSGIELLVRASQDVDRGALETAEAFILVSPVRPTGESVEILARRVAEGQPLLAFIDGPDADALLGSLSGASGGAIAPPFTLRRPVGTGGAGEPLAEARTLDGPLAVFHAADSTDLLRPRFRRHWLTSPDPSRGSEIIATYGDGSAALSISPAGRGSVLIANLPLSPDGSDLAGSPLFPALLHECLRALRSSTAEEETAPGEPWHVDAVEPSDAADSPDAGGEDPPYRVLAPDGSEVAAAVVSRGRVTRLALPPVERPGPYRVLAGDRPVGVGVVNVAARETDTRRLPLAQLASQMGSGDRVAVVDESGEESRLAGPRLLWPECLALAAAALGAEMLLLALWQTGRRKESPR